MSSIHAQKVSQEAEILAEVDSGRLGLENSQGNSSLKDLSKAESAILRVYIALLVMVPLFRGGNTELVSSTIPVILFLVLAFAIASKSFTGSLGRLGKRLAVVSCFIAALFFVQMLPLPVSLINLLSPSSGNLYSGVAEQSGFLSIDLGKTLSSSLPFLALIGAALLIPFFGSFDVVTRVASFRRIRRKRSRNEIYEQARRIDYVVDFVQRSIVFVGLCCAIISLAHLTLNIKLLFGLFGADMLFAINPQRAHWPFVNPNHLAALLEISLMTAFARFLRMNLLSRFSKRSHRRDGSSFFLLRNPERIGTQSFRFISIFVMLLALMLTLSRSGVVLSVVGMLVLWLWYAKAADAIERKDHFSRSEKRGASNTFFRGLWRSRRLIVLGLAGLFVLFFLGQSGRAKLANRVEYGLTHSYDQARMELASASFDVMKEFPLFGSGLGTWRLSVAKHIPETLAGWQLDYAHNEFLQFGAETGFLGLFGVIFALMFVFAAFKRKWKAELPSSERVLILGALMSVMLPVIHGLVDFHFQIPAVALVFCAALGVLVRLLDSSGSAQ